MDASIVSVLVVDDHEPFRRLVCSRLAKMHGLQVIGEASDGLEAVRKAEELRPDLIVLDIGLPTLDGLEVARRIRNLCPECKILFMSQLSVAEVVQEAFSRGAMGYVVKSDAARELLAAVEAVSQGRQFVSKRLAGGDCTGAADAQAPGHLSTEQVLPSLAAKKTNITHSHEVQFYSDDGAFLFGLACFIETALEARTPVIAVATESHLKSLLQRLLARGVNAAAAMEQGMYLPLEVNGALSTFMVNDRPDPVRFMKAFGDLLSSAAKAHPGKHPQVAACGEFAPTLWAQGKADAAIQVEHLTDEVAKTRGVNILCGYVLSNFPGGDVSRMYERICAEHSAIRSL